MDEKKKTGRPTKYDEEIQRLADEYVNNHLEKGDLVPTIVGLAIELDVATNTIYNWATEDKPAFLRTFMRVEQLQHRALVNGGLSGDFNPAITKMMLTHHGYSDQQNINHTSSDGSMTPTRIEIVAPQQKEDDDS